MTIIPDSADPAAQPHRTIVLLPENIIIVSDISIITGYLDAIAEMEHRSFAPPWSKNDFAEELRSTDARVLLLLKNCVPKGYLCSRLIFDEAHINKMCVHHDVRGLGYGKLLLNEFVRMRAGLPGKIYLEVARSNMAAIALYRGAGFRVNRVRQTIYENGDDAFEMVLDH